MDSAHSDSLSSPSPSSGSVSSTQMIDPDQMMDWKQWERYMAKIQSRGLNRFLNRYVVTNRMDIRKFLVNLELTITIALTEQSDDDDHDQNLNKVQALVRLENSILKFLKIRKKLPEYNSIDDAVSLIQRAQRILILTGAGISTCLESENGLYSQLEDYEGLDDPHDMFDLKFFKSNPLPFYKFLKTIFPFSSTTTTTISGSSNNDPSTRSASAKPIIPSDSHRFIKLVESNSKLLRNYSLVNVLIIFPKELASEYRYLGNESWGQEFDTMSRSVSPFDNYMKCSFAKFTCLKCRAKYPANQFEDSIARSQVVLCPTCRKPEADGACSSSSNKRRKVDIVKFDAASSDDELEVDWVDLGLMKPDIIFFVCHVPFPYICLISGHPSIPCGINVDARKLILLC
ncbi:hypothetical protein VP01_7g1 [Puccinia sorghi]|uniref:Deacetylase sirtuin-type domain-containing protein n=1 Tax=Puccinia sorghi TaxID=27349 RepID=A0A0L6UAM1_9BASI|nr:hypothetical protein VP01_7g1 [Puccinia sorghi]